MNDLYLKASTESALYEALEAAGVAEIQWLGRGEVVSDPELIAALDMQPVDDDLTCEYEGNHYAARDGQWLILLPVAVPVVGYALDLIGTITKPTGEFDSEGNAIHAPIDGYHANIYTEMTLTDEQRAVLPLIDTPKNSVRVRA